MSRSTHLELEVFEQLLAVHGAKLERWPEELSAAARQLIEVSAAARARWSEAARLEVLLDAVPAVEPSVELIARIATLPARHPRPPSLGWWPFGNPFAPLLAWGAAAALGLIVGTMVPEREDGEAPDPEVTEVAAPGDEWSELSELAMGGQWSLEEE
jgi:hypothetical protein